MATILGEKNKLMGGMDSEKILLYCIEKKHFKYSSKKIAISNQLQHKKTKHNKNISSIISPLGNDSEPKGN